MSNWRTLTKADIEANGPAFLAIAGDVEGEYWTLEHLLSDRPDKWRLSFAIWEQGQPIAYAILSRPEPARAHLHHMMVRKEYRGRGIGSNMVREAQERAIEADCTSLSLKTWADRQPLLDFYARFGFQHESVTPNGYAVLVKALGPSGRIDNLEPARMLEGKRGAL